MLSTSFAFRRYVAEGRHLATKAVLTFADGTTQTIYGDAMTLGGASFSTATSSAGSFDIGAAIVGTAEITLANFDERWDSSDFTGATCVLSLGAELDDQTTEWLRKGEYGVEQPESYDSTVTLSLTDNMRLFQVPYSDVGTTYPATLQDIVTDLCLECGVTMLSAGFQNDQQVVATRPDDTHLSCLDVLSWAAQMAGCFCDMDPWGRLRVRWYETSAFEVEDWLDGGTYDTDTTPYSDGDTADGGAFHSGGDTANGGSFQNAPWAVITAIKSLTTTTDDVVITGVSVTAADERNEDGTQGSKGETYLYGTEGYVLAIDGNELVTYGQAQSVANAIGPYVVGMRFRPLTVSSLGDPAIEAGDPILVVDRRQRTYRSWATQVTWKHGGFQSTSCDAQAPARNKAEGYSATTRAIVQQRNMARAEATARELAMRNLQRLISESSGFYETDVEQPDHSIIRYFHDKPTLAESQIVWKFTANAFAFSTDGGRTYPYGIDVNGTAILNSIYAIGLDASYITTGTLDADLITTGRIRSANGNSFWDLDTGAMQLMAYAANIVLGRMNSNGIAGKITLGGDGMKYETALGQLFDVSHGSTVTYQGQQTQTGILTLGDTSGTRLKISTDSGSTSTPYVSVQALNGHLWLRGSGASGATADVVIGSYSAKTYINGQLEVYPGPLYGRNITETSDRRLKDHIAYLGDKARKFIRALKPALFTFKDEPDGKRHTGFYAQDVREADPWGSGAVLENEEGKLFLNYSALIAPLVAYTQEIGQKLDEQQQTINELNRRLDEAGI